MTCTLCGQTADFLLVYLLTNHRVEVLLCSAHLEMVQTDMLEATAESSMVKMVIEPVTPASLIPGPRTTRFPSPPPPDPSEEEAG